MPNIVARIVFCEDNQTIQRLIQASMRGSEHDVVIAGDGAEGLKRLREGGADVVVTDLSMPHMDGLELLARLQADPELAGIPVIVLTASAEEARGGDLLARGAAAYITKPFPPRQLLAQIEEVLGRQNSLR
jgi:CheY-like chemotaxis protein